MSSNPERVPIGVGVVGASPVHPGWAVAAHIPAIQALPEFTLRAVGTSRRESAEAAARAFGVPGFDDPAALVAVDGVDLVVVSVKVPEHHDIVMMALAAGRMVLSEWPLARDVDDAQRLSEAAGAAGVRTAVTLQARYAPVVQQARALVAGGYVGQVLATTLVGSGGSWGATASRSQAYLFDAANGATVVSVSLMHALEALTCVLGEFDTLTAVSAVRRSSVRITDDDSMRPVTAPDHIAVTGRLRSGALVSVFYRGGLSRGDNLRWEINGTDGDLEITAAQGNLQVADLHLRGGRRPHTTLQAIDMPAHATTAPGGLHNGIAANVLRQYAALARDIRQGTRTVPDFAYALQRHRLLATIETAARTGLRQTVPS